MRKAGKRQGTEAILRLVVRIAHAEISAIGMLEHERAHARFGVHHHAFGELDADFVGTQQLPDSGLIIEIGTRWVAKAVALPAIF